MVDLAPPSGGQKNAASTAALAHHRVCLRRSFERQDFTDACGHDATVYKVGDVAELVAVCAHVQGSHTNASHP